MSNTQTTTSTPYVCGWRCGDDNPEHVHYAVLIREHGALLGRIAPDGSTAHNRVHASVLSLATATKITADINSGTGNLIDGLSAKVIRF